MQEMTFVKETPDLRRDFLETLECRRTFGRVPWWDLEFQVWDAFAGQRLILGAEFAALDAPGRANAIEKNADAFLQALQEVSCSAVTLPSGFWDSAPGKLAYFVLPDDTRFAQLQALKKRVGESVALVANCGGAVLGADYDPDFCLRLFEEPEAIDREVESRLHQAIEDAKRWRDMGADAVFSASDMADNSGPFFNPGQMERWILPGATRWAAAIKEMGMKPILHSDGNLSGYLEQIAATGVCALQAIDPVAGMNLPDALSKVRGRMALAGNLDCGLLVAGTPDTIEATALAMLQAHGLEPGWIFGASNAVQQEVPVDNIRAVIRAVNRHRRSQPISSTQ
jgi:hypothetical protein